MIKNSLTLYTAKQITQSVLRRLLNGQFEKEEDIVKELKNHKMELKCSEYLVMAVRYINEMFHEGKPKNFEGFFIDRICQYIPGAMVCFTEKNMSTVLFSYSGEDLESFVKNCVERIENEIFAKYSTKTLIGIGNKVSGLNEISRSYEEACETVKYSFLMDGQHFYFYRELPQGDDYIYPIEVENALFKSVLETDSENDKENDSQSRGQKICREVRSYIELYYSKPDLSLDVFLKNSEFIPITFQVYLKSIQAHICSQNLILQTLLRQAKIKFW